MTGETPSRWASRCTAVLAGILVTLALFASISLPAVAQFHGIPPSVTSIQNHFPPYMPNVPPSVTSLGPHGAVGPPAFPVYPHYPGIYPGRPGFGPGYGYGHGRGYGYGYGGYGSAYAVPYYIPYDDASYGGDAGGGPYLYSGLPDPTMHVVVDLPPGRSTAEPYDEEQGVQSARSEAAPVREVLPIDPTVLVFRDGHRQQVTNYAVMGQTLYVFDDHRQKILLRDLDLPATVKVNDDRGVEFQLPKTS